MFSKSDLVAGAMGCCSCFGFGRKRQVPRRNHSVSQDYLLEDEEEEDEIDDNDNVGWYNGETTDCEEAEQELPDSVKRTEEILNFREQNGMICRQFPVKQTHHLIRSEDENGIRTINEYVRVCKIGSGSYGKVVLYRSNSDRKHYAIKAFHKSHLVKQRVAPSESAMTDVLREVVIMNMIEHPNTVNLIEVINDPNTDHFYMVLEYVDGRWAWEGSFPPLGENTARRYMRDIVSGLMYLHAHNIVHLDIKPDNLLVTLTGVVKIGDFSVSQVFEGDNDVLQRSPGTPVFTAPECCLGLSYRGRAADTWALGVTLYCMILGKYPFLGESLQDQYDKIVNNPLVLPADMNPQLRELIEGLLCKDPAHRMTLEEVAKHAWVVGKDGSIRRHLCWCERRKQQREQQRQANGDQDKPLITLSESESDRIEAYDDDRHVVVTNGN